MRALGGGELGDGDPPGVCIDTRSASGRHAQHVGSRRAERGIGDVADDDHPAGGRDVDAGDDVGSAHRLHELDAAVVPAHVHARLGVDGRNEVVPVRACMLDERADRDL